MKPITDELGEILTDSRLGHESNGRLTNEVLEGIDEVRPKSVEARFYAMDVPREVGGEGVSAVAWYGPTNTSRRKVAAFDTATPLGHPSEDYRQHWSEIERDCARYRGVSRRRSSGLNREYSRR